MGKITRSLAAIPLFIALGSNAATFTSNGGAWNNPATWSVVGADSDNIPDSDDDVTLPNATSTSMNTNGTMRTLAINNGATLNLNGFFVNVFGSITNNGIVQFSGRIFMSSSGTFSSPSAIPGGSGGNIDIYFQGGNITIAAGSFIGTPAISINAVSVFPGVTVTNLGTVDCQSIFNISTGGTFINGAGGVLTLDRNISGGGTLLATGNPNTVTFQTNNWNQIPATTYHHLVLTGSTGPAYQRTLLGTITVNGNITFGAGMFLNWNNFSIDLRGNWTNTGNQNHTNQGTLILSGTGNQSIARFSSSERFAHITHTGSGTVFQGSPSAGYTGTLILTGNFTNSAGTWDVNHTGGTGNHNITLAGNFSNTATFQARQGTVITNGTAGTQTFSGSATLYNFIKGNNAATVDFTGNYTLINLLTINAGTVQTSGTGTVTVAATGPTTYGRLGLCFGSMAGTGWIIQSYINGPATAYWQYLSSPISGSTINDWDQDTRFYMSGVGGNDGTACCPTFFSVRTYNEVTNTYSNVTSTATALGTGQGFMVWMGDDLNLLQAPLIYDTRGLPHFGNRTRAITAGGSGGGYNLVGNPYACPVTFSTVRTASGNIVNSNFLVLDETGAYQTSPNGGVIAPNQGFLVAATSSGNLTFTESCKNTSALPNILRMADPENYIRINTRSVMNGLGGEAVVQLEKKAAAAYEMESDLRYIASPYEMAANVWTLSEEREQLLLNALGTSEDELLIPLVVQTAVAGEHSLSFRGINRITDYSCAWLEDPSTGMKIDLSKNPSYTFYANTAGIEKRFLLRLERNDDCRLADQGLQADLDAMTKVFVNNDNLLLQFSFEELTPVTVSVYNMLGQEVMSPRGFMAGNQTEHLEVPRSHGIYLVRIQTASGMAVTKKIYY